MGGCARTPRTSWRRRECSCRGLAAVASGCLELSRAVWLVTEGLRPSAQRRPRGRVATRRVATGRHRSDELNVGADRPIVKTVNRPSTDRRYTATGREPLAPVVQQRNTPQAAGPAKQPFRPTQRKRDDADTDVRGQVNVRHHGDMLHIGRGPEAVESPGYVRTQRPGQPGPHRRNQVEPRREIAGNVRRFEDQRHPPHRSCRSPAGLYSPPAQAQPFRAAKPPSRLHRGHASAMTSVLALERTTG